MLEIYREDGLRCLSLQPAKDAAGLSGEDSLDLVELYLQARSEAGFPTVAAEVFFPGQGGREGRLELKDGEDKLDVCWQFSFPKAPGDKTLALLLTLTGSLPFLDEMRSPRAWLGGCYRLEMDKTWADSLGACGLSRDTLREELHCCLGAEVRISFEEDIFQAKLLERADLLDDGRFVCDVHPLALYALLGLDAQYCLEDAADVVESDAAWTPGLLTLACALGEELPVEDETDEVSDELSPARLLELVCGPCPEKTDEVARGALLKKTAVLLELMDHVAGWQVRSFTEIADQQEGPSPVSRGETVWRVTHTGA